MTKKCLFLVCAYLPSCSSEKASDQSTTESSGVTATSVSSMPTGEGEPFVCREEERLIQAYGSANEPRDLMDAGLVWCSNGLLHRDVAVHCSYPLKATECPCDEPCGDLGDGVCHAGLLGCDCAYPCADDADCLPKAACLCASSSHKGTVTIIESQCVPADCRSDMDCAGYLCTATVGECGYVEGLHCKSPNDVCRDDQHCLELGLGTRCFFDRSEERWACGDYIICE